MTSAIDQNQLLRLMAMQGAIQESDDWDDEDDYYDDDDDFEFADYEDDAEEGFMFESDDDYDDDDETWDGEARRRRRGRKTSYRKVRSRNLRKMKGAKGTTLKAPNGQQMRVKFGESFAKAKDVNKLIADTEAKFKAALKERRENHTALSKKIADVDGNVGKVSGRVKKLEGNAQTSQLMSLLSSPPKIESMTFEDVPGADNQVKVKSVNYAKQDMMLPLILSGALGDTGGDNSALLLMALSQNN
ncbi:hypothetical protein BVC71_14225 [Marivivens niveibacter]|uniref:Uncharacterized protein n=1 Tax=Marivivens niveibacter TaxID=1930667 RepID=A0A251WW84_9RHOB|nr:hypothetical protein [Marivivens niveibacter]OUD08324.1 hypothetical protein BVC71_14225 [Marivivens niveibacter]